MICNVAIEYPKEMNVIDFRDEVIAPVSLKAARQIIHNIVYEEDFDNSIAIPEDPYVGVELVPRVKNLIQKALTDELKGLFIKDIFYYVSPFSQAEMDEGIPGDVMHNTPVKLRAAKDGELLQFVFSADLNLRDEQQPMWQNTKIDINYVKAPEKIG